MAESCSAVSGVAIAGGADISKRLVARVRSTETSKTVSLFWEAPVCTRGVEFYGGFDGGGVEPMGTQSQGFDEFHIHLLRVVVVQVVDLPARHESSLCKQRLGCGV